MSAITANRKLNGGVVFLMGLVVGVLCYLVAEALIPKQLSSAADHDVFLANRLGFTYAPIVGLWLGWLQRSWRRAAFGMGMGIVIGFGYTALCASRNFLAIMVGFPCLLGGVLAGVVGSNRSPWLSGLGGRIGKGLLAGLVLGFVYMAVLNIGGGMVMTAHDSLTDETQRYIAMMWRAGPVALGLSSALFFVLARWAVGLTRVRILVFEDVEHRSVEATAAPNGGPAEPQGDSVVPGGPPLVS
jgi:hypothetical protein